MYQSDSSARADTEVDMRADSSAVEFLRRLSLQNNQFRIEVNEKLDQIDIRLAAIEQQSNGSKVPRHLTTEQAADHYGVSAYSIRRWIKCGKLRAKKVKGSGHTGHWLIEREALIEVL